MQVAGPEIGGAGRSDAIAAIGNHVTNPLGMTAVGMASKPHPFNSRRCQGSRIQRLSCSPTAMKPNPSRSSHRTTPTHEH